MKEKESDFKNLSATINKSGNCAHIGGNLSYFKIR